MYFLLNTKLGITQTKIVRIALLFVVIIFGIPVTLVHASPHYDDIIPPTNPNTCLDVSGSSDNVWQSSTNDPSFTWSGADGTGSLITGYAVYWGSSSGGQNEENIVLTEGYDPPAVTTGTFYLRVSTKEESGLSAPWETIYTYKYDGSSPTTDIMTVTESGGALDNTWQHLVTSPSFTISGFSDPDSGFSHYFRYFGSDPSGTDPTTFTSADNTLTPGSLTDGTYFLRVKLVDQSGNESAWTTLFTYLQDTVSPDPVSSPAIETHSYPENTWLHPAESPAFTWSAAAGTDIYRIYWGTDPSGTNATDSSSTNSYSPSLAGATGVYTLRIQSEDLAGNSSGWTTMFTFWFDNSSPSSVTTVTEFSGLTNGICQTNQRSPDFSWDPAIDNEVTLAGYHYYWGSDPAGSSSNSTTNTNISPGLVPRNEIYYFRLSPFDDLGNAAPWETEFIICHADDVDYIAPTESGSVSIGVPDPFGAYIALPADAYPDPYYARIWFPDIHPDLTAGKAVPYGHNSFTFSVEKSSDLSQISPLNSGASSNSTLSGYQRSGHVRKLAAII